MGQNGRAHALQPEGTPSLVMMAGTRACAIPLASVVETFRPLPVEPITGMPSFVRGVSIIRGAPVPVVALSTLVGADEARVVSRFVTLKVGDRRVALAVERVVGISELAREALLTMPPLLQDARTELVAAIGTLDEQLLLLLRATRILPEAAWDAIALRQASP